MSVYKPDWLEAKQRITDWWAGKKVDRVVANVTAPVKSASGLQYIGKSPDKYIDVDTVFNNLDYRLNNTFWGGEAFPFHFVYFGPMFASTISYGALPKFSEATTWYDPCFDNLDEIIAYKPDLANNKWRRLMTTIQKKSAERSRGSYLVSSSHMSAAIDTLAGLMGSDNLLYAMVEEPEKVIKARDALWELFPFANEESFSITRECNDGGEIGWLGIWAPGKMITDQCDLCVMISPDMFDEFVFDDLKTAYDQADYGIYHLDGEDQIRHLDSLFRLEKIRMIQWVPAKPDNVDPLNCIDLFKRIQNTGRSVNITTPHNRVKDLLCKVDRDLVYLTVSCPDVETAHQVLRELEK